MPTSKLPNAGGAARRTSTSPAAQAADREGRQGSSGISDRSDEPLGARDELDVALLRLHRLALAATVRAGNEVSPAVTPTQIRAMTLLAASPDGMALSAIADALYVSAPSASRLCQRLVRDGLATRSAGPGHYILIALAPEGARVLRTLNQARVKPFRQLVDALPDRRRAAAVAQLTDLGRLAGEHHGAF